MSAHIKKSLTKILLFIAVMPLSMAFGLLFAQTTNPPLNDTQLREQYLTANIFLKDKISLAELIELARSNSNIARLLGYLKYDASNADQIFFKVIQYNTNSNMVELSSMLNGGLTIKKLSYSINQDPNALLVDTVSVQDHVGSNALSSSGNLSIQVLLSQADTTNNQTTFNIFVKKLGNDGGRDIFLENVRYGEVTKSPNAMGDVELLGVKAAGTTIKVKN